jgi:hypothetical protein
MKFRKDDHEGRFRGRGGACEKTEQRFRLIFSERFRNHESAGVSARLEPSNPRGRTESDETAIGPNGETADEGMRRQEISVLTSGQMFASVHPSSPHCLTHRRMLERDVKQ